MDGSGVRGAGSGKEPDCGGVRPGQGYQMAVTAVSAVIINQLGARERGARTTQSRTSERANFRSGIRDNRLGLNEGRARGPCGVCERVCVCVCAGCCSSS